MSDWTPTKLECEIAAAVLQEYSENRGMLGRSWAVKFIEDLFPRVASYYDDLERSLAEEGMDVWRPLSHKQHHGFWNVITNFGWRNLASHYPVIQTVGALQRSMKATYDGRWIEEETKQIRRRFDELASEAFRELVSLKESSANDAAA